MTTVATPVIQHLKDRRVQLQAYLPKGVDIKSVLAQVHTAIMKDEKIAACNLQSVFSAVASIAAWGAEIGREAYLVPYGKTCTPIIDYKYLCAMVQMITGYAPFADVVYEGDLFEYEQGSAAYIKHKPASAFGKKRGAFLGVYAFIERPGGKIIPVWIAEEEVERYRQKYSQSWKEGKVAPEWWAEKLALKRLIKTMPKNPSMADRFGRLEKMVDQDGEEVVIQDTNETRARIESAREPVTQDGVVIDDLETPDFEVHDEPATAAAAAPAAAEMPLEKARALILPGDSKKWGGKGGFRLDRLRTHMLVSLSEWCEKQLALGPQGIANAQELIDGAKRVMKAYDSGELQEPEPSKPATPPLGSESSDALADRLGKNRETAKAGVGAGPDDGLFD